MPTWITVSEQEGSMGMNERGRPSVPILLVMALMALIASSACGGSSDKDSEGDGAAAPEKNTVVLRDIAFKPDKLQVGVGDTVTWRFEDKGISHDVSAQDGSFKSEVTDSGTFEHTFEKAGTYAYICSLHPTEMKATVEVG